MALDYSYVHHLSITVKCLGPTKIEEVPKGTQNVKNEFITKHELKATKPLKIGSAKEKLLKAL